MTAPREVVFVDGRGADFHAVHSQPSQAFLAEVGRAVARDKVVVDAGTGHGATALRVAPHAKEVVGVDADRAALKEAGKALKKTRLRNVRFVEGDLEGAPWTAWAKGPVDVVLAHRFAFAGIFGRAREILAPGGAIVVAALGPEQWRETGVASRFAFSPEDLARHATEAGFRVEAVRHELLVVSLPSFDYVERVYFANAREVEARWKESGRWRGLADSFAKGATTLTESRVVLRAAVR